MMSDYAVIWTTDSGYFPGTNASLNALEFYKNEVDVFILTWTDFLNGEYKSQWPGVRFLLLDRSIYPNRSAGWYLRFMDIDFALKELFRNYKVVLFWSADQCVVSNIMDFFEIAGKTGRPILGTNEHGVHLRTFDQMSKEKPYKHTWSVPYTDQPVFVPREATAFLKMLIEYQSEEGCELSRMDGINYAVRDTGMRIIETPGELWIQNIPYRIFLQEFNHKIYLRGSSTQLFAFHRRYWDGTVCRDYLPGNDDRSIAIGKANKILFNKFYNFFNRQCRVKWEQGIDVWNG